MLLVIDFLGPLICTFSVLITGVFPRDHVPALLWSMHSSLWDLKPAAHEGHITSGNELHSLLQPIFTQNSKNLVLFLQDKLSVEDFTYYSDAPGNEKPFHNVQEILGSSPSSLVLPAVDWKATSHLLDHLRKKAAWRLVNISDPDASELVVEPSTPNLIVVKLQPCSRTNDVSTVKAFVETDKQIGKLTKILLGQGITFSAIYTALRPSRAPIRAASASQTGRRLMATEVQSPTVPDRPLNWTNGTEPCILLYATNLTLRVDTFPKPIDLTNATFFSNEVDISSSVCTDTNSTLSLRYKNPMSANGSLEVRFLMTNKFYAGSARHWFTLDSIQIFQDDVKVAEFNTSMPSAPAEYSFHCQLVGTSELAGARLVLNPITNQGVEQKWDIVISDFQIQGFNIKNNQFSYASDCASFFTPAIWMGLVTSIILLWILAYGIFMIMRLSTNDKFDDPKGQTLSVPQTD
ncbi:V-type proton ATPase subunit S1-like [Rhinatrema bivittatum]|uniref:V-type proton ATPase subunit S1-like n=1 Tax=Rhinatrema bivittatum TaxID=194408 RepID=UPI0011282CBC|nr:V-type proton ATPase subunit S1-like [Rhinatrema bivittatum]